MEFKFELKLRRMAIQSFVLSLWNRNDIQFDLKQLLCFEDSRTIICDDRYKKLIRKVMSKIDQKNLPSSLYYELLPQVKSYGYSMRAWFICLKRDKVFQNYSRTQIYEKLFATIYWTYYGTIDEEKIFRHFWLKNNSIDLLQAYIVACRYCLVDVIENLWKKRFQKKVILNDNSLGFHLVVYWNKLRENNLSTFENNVILPNTTRYNGRYQWWMPYEQDESLIWNMARLSILKGYVSAFKYFWNEMSFEEKCKNADSFISDICFCVKKGSNCRRYRPRKRKHIEIFIFLLNFLSKNQENLICDTDWDTMWSQLIEFFAIMIIDKFPWQELLSITFNVKHSCYRQYVRLFEKLISKIYKDYVHFGIPAKQNKLRELLQQLWRSITPEFKKPLLEIIEFERWNELFATEDFSLIGMIFGDASIPFDVKNKLLYKFCSNISLILAKEEKEFSFLNFIAEVAVSRELSSTATENSFQEYLKSILVDPLKQLDEKLNFYQNEINIRMEINAELICLYFVVKEQYEACDIFLKWKFNVPRKIKIFKNNLFYEETIINRINYFWCGTQKVNADTAKIRSENFLFWIFETEEKVLNFKTEHLLHHKSTRYNIITDENFEILEDYLSWCLVNPGDIKKTKRFILKHENGFSFLLKKYMAECDIEMAEKLLKWAFDSEVERITFMNHFISFEGFAACRTYIENVTKWKYFGMKHSTEDVSEKFKRFINFFIKPHLGLKGFNELKQELLMLHKDYGSDNSSDYKTDFSFKTCIGHKYRKYEEEKDSYAYYVVQNRELFLSSLDGLKPEQKRKLCISKSTKRKRKKKV